MTTVRGHLARLALVSATTAFSLAALAGPASAHVEVSADKARAGATDVTLSFAAESESTRAGIVSLRVVLPAGIAPADVTWVSGPSGWTLKPGTDGYTVTGPALKPGADAKYRVKVAALPGDARSLAFKTLQTYSDGRVDRWIEIPTGGSKPDNPAPVLALAPAATPASGPTTAVSPTPTPEVSSSAPTPASSPA
ncbi:MAG TPA: DUF1775 domain-containing protein, partial [Micromonospora sp.]